MIIFGKQQRRRKLAKYYWDGNPIKSSDTLYRRKKMGMNHVPDNIPALMERDFGTVVLITDPKSDYFMKKAAKKVKNNKKTD
jgi:hypothetical protein